MTLPPGGPVNHPDLAPGVRRTEIDPRVLAQERVDSLLLRGVILSILWIGGIGSIAAMMLASRASEHIRHSGGALNGAKRIMWCYVVGTLGLLVWVPYLLDYLGFDLSLPI